MAAKTHVLLLLFSFILCVLGGAEENCDPVCEKGDSFVADPYSCSLYYYCISPGTPSGPYECNGTIFDPATKPNHDDPKEPCKKETNPPCKAICEKPVCQVVCQNTFDLVVHPQDCGVFYVCIAVNDTAFTKHEDICPSDRAYFNGDDCTSHKEDCCDVCNPSCEGKEFGEQIPNPTNCNDYYFCDGKGNMSESQNCFGGHFDITTNKCVQGTVCEPMCPEPTIPPATTKVPSVAPTNPPTNPPIVTTEANTSGLYN